MNMITLLLPYQAPWDWQQFHSHFALRAIPGLESLSADSYSRGFSINGLHSWLQVTPQPALNALALCCESAAPAHVTELERRVRRMFDLDCQPEVIAQHLSADPLLAPLLLRNPGLRLPVAFDPFEQAVRAIVGQQVTVKAAVTIVGRLVQRFGARIETAHAPSISHLFPTPQVLAAADLTGIGMPGKRVQCLQHFAGRIADGSLKLQIQDGSAALIEQLCALPGIGPWTAQYIALRAFGEADAFPASDLGLLKAPIWGADGIDARRLQRRAEAWRPWRAYAAAHLWQCYSGG
ncbi:3-methyladenine DNA glycosylase 2 [Pseudomonas sp. 8Z]|uniref:DNA-3-methyladenine glycosylase family protein n=1 Tax=Pseudomonas sp. 8Z TaxID=2653166 RepID=UPI0012F12B74|nr:DNA-3-methyladenine glycosylase [Pseudomonas sp. 8Z]VXC38524.1 3-methyladenine DNA glycosylase 2 [Pseudomonas sp. 8Z]